MTLDHFYFHYSSVIFLKPCKDYIWILEIIQVSVLFLRYSPESKCKWLQATHSLAPRATKHSQIWNHGQTRNTEEIQNASFLTWTENFWAGWICFWTIKSRTRICRNLTSFNLYGFNIVGSDVNSQTNGKSEEWRDDCNALPFLVEKHSGGWIILTMT